MILNFPWSPLSFEMGSKGLMGTMGLLPPDKAA